MAAPRIDLTALDLFGNDAAEDEDEEVFQAYAVERDEIANFADASRKLCFVRAFKGEGKSALLRLSASKVQAASPAAIVVRESAVSLVPNEGDDYPLWVRAWKGAILQRVAVELGARIGIAWTDDAIGLVEEAERNGFKARNLISTIVDRISVKAKVKLDPVSLEGNLKKLGTPNPGAVVKRWLEGKEPVWLFLDDVDQNFQNTTKGRLRVASFFGACRELSLQIPALRLRASVRPNVWTTIKLEFEALSHVEQYITNLAWSEESNRRLLAKRVEGYLQRRGLWDEYAFELPTDQAQRDRTLIAQVFVDPMSWGRARERPPHVLLHTLSKHRPRWLVELSKEAAKHAHSHGASRIRKEDILQELDAFGNRRIHDTVAEFKSQCPEVEELIVAFRRAPEEFSTDELLRLINDRILNHLSPRISGTLGQATNRDVAAFLFEIGFFFGRRAFADGSYEHLTFSDRPTLFKSRTAIDDGLRWEIHPVFRQALEIRDSEGHEVARREDRVGAGIIRRRKG